ncbi:ATP-NAD kinase family protein [Paenirhodobacter populi]|uniref:Acetoin catabolism protein X n=1 Tax=Paenirhodobacter populi TaxID=2306993 RepID=A0A443J9K0_9RHOB|nr:NAD(+)/NADH kinase [Sinirhodobacter populi]RWR05566.1 acetoin catabolism protein X [Sinirhodobacter populi]RWR17173.1 acetoin catabolism protein X [Sinirhodobacter populi]
MVKVGIIANPISARDIRRVISHAGNLPINDRANIVLRMMAGLAATGVDEVVVMPENGGIRFHLERIIQRELRLGHMSFPQLRYLDMPVTATAGDSARAARMMAEGGVAAIVVLGGDGTNRVVVGACGGVPVAGVSTGTNNAFPELREPTITGLAVGLAATGQVPPTTAFRPNKWLEVALNDRREIALVDVAVVEDRFVGTRAIWKTNGFRDLFVTFGLPQAIGMSAIAGLLDPVDRAAPEGRHIRLSPDAPRRLLAPIAPGLIDRVGIAGIETMRPGAAHRPSIPAGALAFDGERELIFTESDEVSVRLVPDAFRTIDVPACMAHAALAGLFIRNPD